MTAEKPADPTALPNTLREFHQCLDALKRLPAERFLRMVPGSALSGSLSVSEYFAQDDLRERAALNWDASVDEVRPKKRKEKKRWTP